MPENVSRKSVPDRDNAAILRRRRLLASIVAVLIVAVGVVAWQRRPKPSASSESGPSIDVDAALSRANRAFKMRDFSFARKEAERVLTEDFDNPAALLLVAKCLESTGQVRAAAEKYAEVPPGHPPFSTEAAWRRGHLLFLKLHRPADAEDCYRRALKENPNSLSANIGSTVLYGFSGQWWKQISSELGMIRSGGHESANLYSLAEAEKGRDKTVDLARFQQTNPSDPLVRLAAARSAIDNQKYADAISTLNAALRDAPDLVQGRIWLGQTYLELNRQADFIAWSKHLPPTAESHPSVWILRGKWARENASAEAALRCFCEAVQRDPNRGEALYQAGQLLTAMGRSAEAAPFLQRAKTLQAYINTANTATTKSDLGNKRRAAELAERLGNTWEAYGWAALGASHPSNPRWAREMVALLEPRLNRLLRQRTEPHFNPVRNFEFRKLPLPSITSPGAGRLAKTKLTPTPGGRIGFEDRAREVGINFHYFNGSPNVSNGVARILEFVGGGIGVLDLNGDLRPDLYFTQGCGWPVDESRFEHLDQLYLNQGDGKYINVTDVCGIRENGYSHGVAVGDYNSDGFPDLLVGNIGRNRLFQNNGDGTFTDISEQAGLTRSDWTTSCAIADLTGDGHPELYFVNYLAGDDVFTRTCGGHVCFPQYFPGAYDRLHWNSGDGRFRDVTRSAGIQLKDGRGLGIVIATHGGAKLPSIFIANDTSANFYFENRTKGKQAEPRFRDGALVKGLALGDRGTTQACMGVAAGDADGDSEIELFVTNFHAESNAYYRYQNGSFHDAARTRGLRQPSLSKLGFGTQFLDADRDGWLDLIVANGHIDDFSKRSGTEYQMQPQFFVNRGKGHFRELDAAAVGSYFQRKLLGRGLARLDWNGDGREEAVISHVDAPAALLENRTENAGGFLALHLRGVQSNRDAITAVVQAKTKTRTLTRQLTAGDGYLASNERILIFGLGAEKMVEKLTIRWPSGRTEEFKQLPANTRWIAVEGAGRLFASTGPN